MKQYNEVVEYILSIPKFASKIGINNLSQLMEQLNDPHLNYKTIHVAGTNGKGSVSTFIKEFMINSGHKVGIFTSPHLIDITERIAVDRVTIAKDDFVRIFNMLKSVIDSNTKEGISHPSFFEVIFAMAAIWFDEQKVDYAVFETGMGGRYDATNILVPEISVITSIGLDHIQYLGGTISAIAYEKAGIIKKGIPVISNTNNIEADIVIINEANKMEAPLFSVEKNDYIINEISDKSIDFSIHSSYYKYDKLQIKDQPVYQVDNFSTALMTYHTLFKKSDILLLKKVLDSFSWSGRMEKIAPNIIVDGAHNEEAILEFVRTIKAQYNKVSKQLLFAVAGDKDYNKMIKILAEELDFNYIYITALSNQRKISAQHIKNIFIKYKGHNEDERLVAGDEIEEMLETAINNLGEDTLFVVGSLYLVGQIKEMLTV